MVISELFYCGIDIWHVHIDLPSASLALCISISIQKDKQNKPVKYPEDIQVILRSDRIVCGNLYVANVEAA